MRLTTLSRLRDATRKSAGALPDEVPLDELLTRDIADALDPAFLQSGPEQVEPLAGWELDVYDWRKRYLGHAHYAGDAPHHRRAWDWFDALTPGVEPLALLECWSRGHGKSTTAEGGAARTCVCGTRRLVLYVCRTQEAANRHVQSIADLLSRLGVGREVNDYGYARGWSASVLRAANGWGAIGFGLDAGIRGMKLDEVRPDLIILDDIDDKDDSVDYANRLAATIQQSVLPSGSTDCAVAFVQNAIHGQGVMQRTLTGEIDMLRRRVKCVPIPAVEGLEVEERENPDDPEGLPLYHIVKGVATWDGKPLSVCEAEINKFGLVPFLRECQHKVGAGGLLFADFTPTLPDGTPWHVCEPFPIPADWVKWASHDYGETDPCAGHVFAADPHGDVYVIGEYYEPGKASTAQAKLAIELYERLGLAVPGDPQNKWAYRWTVNLSHVAFDWANTFPPLSGMTPEGRGEYAVEVWWRMGVPAVRAVKDRKAGWRRWREWLAGVRIVFGQRRPRFRIFRGAAPQMEKFLKDAPQHPIQVDELDPGYKDDHAGDSGRYGLMQHEVRAEEDAEEKKNGGPTYERRMPGAAALVGGGNVQHRGRVGRR